MDEEYSHNWISNLDAYSQHLQLEEINKRVLENSKSNSIYRMEIKI